jgi:uncharacterized repeat protein (TIGR01451 family)
VWVDRPTDLQRNCPPVETGLGGEMSGAKERTRSRRPILLWLIVVTALAVGQAGTLSALAGPPVDSPGPASADGVEPVIVDTRSSSADCGSLGFAHGIPISGNGQASSGDLTITVTGYNSPTGFADWSSNLPIQGVYAKGGPSGGNLFNYPTGDTGDQDLHTPRKATGGYYALSHLAFCWNDAPLEPDVTIAKANDPDGAVLKGDSITYTLTVTNQGDATARAVEVTDQLPTGVTFADATPGCTEAGGLVTCALGDIGAGASLDLDVTVIVGEAFCGAMVNAADVSASNESGESLGNNASNGVTNTVECQGPSPPDLQVSKTSDADGILHDGDSFLYTIIVTNVGDEAATGVQLVDVLPAGALNVGIPPFPTFAGEACAVTSSVPEPGGVPHAEVRCDRPVSLSPGESESLVVKVFVSGDVCGEITNVVDVEGANEPAANVGADNHAEAVDGIACVPRIRLQKGGPERAHVGDTITYVFAVTNTGGVDLSNIDLSDPNCDGSPTLTEDADGNDVLAVHEEWVFECEHTITAGDGDPVHNQASVSGDHEGGSVTDTDTHDVSVLHPGIELEKTATPTSGQAGTLIVYTYTVRNIGDTPLFNVSVDDDRVGHVGDIATLPVGGSAQLTSEITLGSSPITNIATAGGADGLGGFVSDDASVTVSVVAGEGGGNGTGGGSPFTGSAAGLLVGWMVVLAALGVTVLMASGRRFDARG